MNINLKGTNILVTDSIKSYVAKRIESVDRFLGEHKENTAVQVELSQTTKHHKSGSIFRTEINLNSNGKRFRIVSTKDDLYASIDDAKEELEREIVANKDKSVTLFRRGARSIKKMLRGLSKRNPFTSKY